MKPKPGFILGDHQFLHPDVNGPLSRFDAPKRQIRGAKPPTYLDGLVRESTRASPAAKALFKGEFCGHGEPTMTIFDVVIDGTDILEIVAVTDEEVDVDGPNFVLLAVRKPKGQWYALFRREWEENATALARAESAIVQPDEIDDGATDLLTARVSIGFEYPCDAGSRDDVTWMTIDALEDGKRKPVCVVNAELA